MKKIKLLLIAIATIAFAAISGCADSDNQGTGFGNDPVTFKSVITADNTQNGTITRATDTTWGTDDIGVYAIKDGLGMTSANVLFDNKMYSTTGDGTFAPASVTENINFPTDGSTMDFVAYYPYKTTLTDYEYPINVLSQTDLPAIDFMFSTGASANQTTPSITLPFKHMLTNLVVMIDNQTGKALDDLVVTLSGTKTESVYSLADKTFTDDVTSVKDIQMATVVTGNEATAKAIILPATAPTGAKLNFTMASAGLSYTWDFDPSQVFAGSTRYTFKFILKAGTSSPIAVDPDGTIDPWDEQGPTNPIEINPDGPNGSFGAPYTLDMLASRVGQQAWITGYIVGYAADGMTRAATANVVLASTAGDAAPADLSNKVIVVLDGNELADWFDLVTNTELVGKQVKFEGTIAAGTAAMAVLESVTAQDGGIEPEEEEPTDGLLFPGADFENWDTFLGCLSTHGLKTAYTSQSADGGRNGSAALYLKGTPSANDYVFTAMLAKDLNIENPSKIIFYIKGTSAKSLSINVYMDNGTNYNCYNLVDYSAEAVIEPTALQTSGTNAGNGTNSYTGIINTAGEWMKVTLDISGESLSTKAGQNIFALKVGKDKAYDLLVDDITIE